MRYLASFFLLPFGFLVQLALSSSEAAEADCVTDLPGLAPQNAVNQFAGFIGIGEDTDTWRRDIFYWFVHCYGPNIMISSVHMAIVSSKGCVSSAFTS